MIEARPLYEAPHVYAAMFDERRDDVAFYTRVCSGSTGVLEYGIGAGRVAIPLARSGLTVTGVDDAPAMLAALATRAREEPADVVARLGWHRGDARVVQLGRRFDRVICPFNGVAHHTRRDELAAFFARVHDHLADDGRFAFDVWLPNPHLLAGATTHSPWIDDPRTGERIRCVETFAYDPIAQVLTTTLEIIPARDDREREVFTLRLRQMFPEETLAILARHGFEVCWRTSTWRAPSPETRDGVALEPSDLRGDMFAYVCRAQRS